MLAHSDTKSLLLAVQLRIFFLCSGTIVIDSRATIEYNLVAITMVTGFLLSLWRIYKVTWSVNEDRDDGYTFFTHSYSRLYTVS